MPAIQFRWEGEDCYIPERKAFKLGDEIEDIVTLPQLPLLFKQFRTHKIARVMQLMLVYAGKTGQAVEIERIHARVQTDLMGDTEESSGAANEAAEALVAALSNGMPKAAKQADPAKTGSDSGNAQGASSTTAS